MPSFSFSPAELSYLHTSLSLTPPIRLDSRTQSQFRPLSAETNILPATNGSAHLRFSEGSEAIVGVKAEVERTVNIGPKGQGAVSDVVEVEQSPGTRRNRGRAEWIMLSIDLPTLRDDDPTLIFLAEMMREALVSDHTLPDALVINGSWHWKLYIDVLLISPYGLSSYPLPLLSLTTHLALLATRLPKLKSQGEEDPLFEDDWDMSVFLYPGAKGEGKGRAITISTQSMQSEKELSTPPITLLVILVGSNVIFDPSREELAVADSIFAISVGSSTSTSSPASSKSSTSKLQAPLHILSIRTIETPARDTMKGVAVTSAETTTPEGETASGVWRPRIGGIKRNALKDILAAVLGDDGKGGVAVEVLEGLGTFLKMEELG